MAGVKASKPRFRADGDYNRLSGSQPDVVHCFLLLWRVEKICSTTTYRDSRFGEYFFLSVAPQWCFLLWASAYERQKHDERQKEKTSRTIAPSRAAVLKHFADFQSKYGRIPKDLLEIEEFVGRPMPTLQRATNVIELSYYPTGQNYLLVYPVAAPDSWNDLVYDSTKPKAGWVETPW